MKDKQITEIYLSKGFCQLNNIENDRVVIESIRKELEKTYKAKKIFRTLWAHQTKNEIINSFIKNLVSSNMLKKFLSELQDKISPENEITIFPPIEFTRNFFSSPQQGNHGWHLDAGGEYRFSECKKLLMAENYVFGKFQVAFQPNTIYGGNIDIASFDFKLNGDRPFREKLTIKAQELIIRICKKMFKTNEIYFRDEYFSDLFLFLIKPLKISTEPLSIFAFDSRVLHRGSPIKPKIYKSLKDKYGEVEFSKNVLSPNISLKEKNKYVFYCQFGNKIGLKSYLYERFRRNNSSSEREVWEKQLNLPYFRKNFPSSLRIYKECLKELGLDIKK